MDSEHLCRQCAKLRICKGKVKADLTGEEREEWRSKIRATYTRFDVLTDIPAKLRRLWGECYKKTDLKLARAKSEAACFAAELEYYKLKAVLVKPDKGGKKRQKQNLGWYRKQMTRWLAGEVDECWTEATKIQSRRQAQRQRKKKADSKKPQPAPEQIHQRELERKQRRVAGLVRMGDRSKAMRAVESLPMLDTSDPAVFEQLQSLCPSSEEEVKFPTTEQIEEYRRADAALNPEAAEFCERTTEIVDESCRGVVVTAKMILEAVGKAGRITAGGLNQITPFHVQRTL